MPHEEDDLVQAMGFTPVVGSTKSELLEQFLKWLSKGRGGGQAKKYARLKGNAARRSADAASAARRTPESLPPSLRADIAYERPAAKLRDPFVEEVPIHGTASTSVGMSPEEMADLADLQAGGARHAENLNLAETLAGGPAQSTALTLHPAPRSRVSTGLEGLGGPLPSARQSARSRRDELNMLQDVMHGESNQWTKGMSKDERGILAEAARKRLFEMGKDPSGSTLAESLHGIGVGVGEMGSAVGRAKDVALHGSGKVLGIVPRAISGTAKPFWKGLKGDPLLTPDELIERQWRDKLKRKKRGS